MTAPLLNLWLDDQPLAVPGPMTLADLLVHLDRPADQLATALNGQFVPRDQRATVDLKDGDRVLFFQAIVGG